jgi:hypothetical protein
LAIVDRVEAVKIEHEKLEGGNKFLQSWAFTSLYLCDPPTNIQPDTLANWYRPAKSHRQLHKERAKAAMWNDDYDLSLSKHLLSFSSGIRHTAYRQTWITISMGGAHLEWANAGSSAHGRLFSRRTPSIDFGAGSSFHYYYLFLLLAFSEDTKGQSKGSELARVLAYQAHYYVEGIPYGLAAGHLLAWPFSSSTSLYHQISKHP